MICAEFKNFDISVPEILELLDIRDRLVDVSRILLKPNLVTSQPHPLDVFRKLGYQKLADEAGVELFDLNTAPVKKLSRDDCPRFPEFFLPEIALTHFIISLPVLKAHSLSDITGSLKNMMGFAPPAYYAGPGGIWNKAEFHTGIHQAIIGLNRYRKADLTLLDASVGMPDYDLGGRTCDPPVNCLIAGFDPKAVDRKAADLLGLDWQNIPHLAASFD